MLTTFHLLHALQTPRQGVTPNCLPYKKAPLYKALLYKAPIVKAPLEKAPLEMAPPKI